MPAAPKTLLVIGAGPMGLATAYYAAKSGWKVDILEAGPIPGGMAAHFDFNGLSLERFYHFCCRSDVDTEALLAELDLPPIRWVRTRMGYYVDGKLHPWGDPLALLRFPGLNLVEKVRYGLLALSSTLRSDWRRLDALSAANWLRTWSGRRAYDKLWRPLLELKFYEHAETVSAAWIWQRMKRLGRSRRSLLEEELGYIEGGSEALVAALVRAIEQLGGKLHLASPVSRVLIEDRVVKGAQTSDGRRFESAKVISTVAMPYVAAMLEARPDLAQRYVHFDNIGVVCVVHQLTRSVTPNFWVNVSDPAMGIPGFVEFSNLRPLDRTIVYVPYYMPTSNAAFGRADDDFIAESFEHLARVNPSLRPEDRVASHVARLKHAQPVCGVTFAASLPPIQTEIAGLQIADTSFYYPEDRGISESIACGRRMAAALERD